MKRSLLDKYLTERGKFVFWILLIAHFYLLAVIAATVYWYWG